MNNPFSNVIIYFTDNAVADGIGNAEMNYPFGSETDVFTWRREDQMVPVGLRIVAMFNVAEAQHHHSVALIERLMEFARDRDTPLEREAAMEIVAMIHAGIRASQEQHEASWGNFPYMDTSMSFVDQIEDHLRSIIAKG